jgi:hypothetical protein
MRTFLVLLALLLPITLSAKDAPDAILKSLPSEIAGCERGELKDYGDARLGQSVVYQVPGLVVTVYIYDQGRPHIADGIGDSNVTKAFEMAKGDIDVATQQGYYSDVKPTNDGKAIHDGGVETLCARYRLTRMQGSDAGQRFFSEIHVLGARGYIIKLRVTGRIEDEAKFGKVLEKFVPAIVKAIKNPRA